MPHGVMTGCDKFGLRRDIRCGDITAMNGIALLRAQYGLITWLAPRLGLGQPALSNWSVIPAERAREIEKITGIPRYLLRPDLWDAPWQLEPPKKISRKRIKVEREPVAAE